MWKTIQCIWVRLMAITSPDYTIDCGVLLILLQLALLFFTRKWAELRYCYCQLKEIKDLKSIVGNHDTVCRDGSFHPAVFVAFWWHFPAHHSCWHILHSLTPAVFSSFCFPFPFLSCAVQHGQGPKQPALGTWNLFIFCVFRMQQLSQPCTYLFEQSFDGCWIIKLIHWNVCGGEGW